MGQDIVPAKKDEVKSNELDDSLKHNVDVVESVDKHGYSNGQMYVIGSANMSNEQKETLKKQLEQMEKTATIVAEPRQVGGIYKALAAVTKDIGVEGIGKNKRNKFQNYNYRGIEDALASFNAIFAKHGVFMLTEVISTEVSTEAGVTEKGKPCTNYLLQMHLKYTFYHADGSWLVGSSFCMNSGKDSSKLMGQITSYALKEYLFKNFFVPVEGMEDIDDRDNDSNNNNPTIQRSVSKPNIGKTNQPYKNWRNIEDAIRWAETKGFSTDKAREIFNTTQPDSNNSRKLPFYNRINAEAAQKSLPM